MLDSGSSREAIDACVQQRLCLISSRIPEFLLVLADNTQIMCNSIVSVILNYLIWWTLTGHIWMLQEAAYFW